MRRFAAHLVLAAMYAGLFTPLLISEENSLHACCLRTGVHHCQGESDEAGFHAKRDACPYSASLPPIGSFGLQPAKFSISTHIAADLVSQPTTCFHSAIAGGHLPARAPPVSLA